MSSTLKKALCVVLSLALLLSTMSVMAFASSGFEVDPASNDTGIYLVSDTETNIAPGIKENKIITNDNSGNKQEMIYAVTIAPDAEAGFMAGFHNYDGSKWKMQTVRAQAYAADRYNKAQGNGRNIVAAVNADIFNMQTGEPTGCLVMHGQVYKAGLGRPYFGVTKGDHKVVMGETMTQEVLDTLEEAVSGFYMIVENGQRVGPGLNPESNIAPKTSAGLKEDGSVVVVTVDGRNYPYSNNISDYELATIMLSLGCVTVINFDGGGSSTYLAKHEGEEELTLVNRPSDAVEREVASSLLIYSTATPSGEFHHAALEPNNVVYTPGSTVEFSAKGADSAGMPVALPENGKFELITDSKALGEITDDGVFTAGDDEGTVTVNYTVDGVIYGATSIELRHPDELSFPADEFSLDYEEVTTFGLTAKYKDREVVLKAGDINWSLVKEEDSPLEAEAAGTFSGLEFTACADGQFTGNVTATYARKEGISSTTKIVIGAEPVMLFDFEYTTNQEEAAASDGKLQWIPTYDLPIFNNKDKTEYNGKTHSDMAAIWREQGYPLYGWPNASLDVSALQASIVDAGDGEPVRFGDHALRLDVDFSSYDKSSNSNNYVRVTSPDYRFEGAPKKMAAWVYCPEGMANFCLYLNLCTNSNGIAYAPISTMNGSVAENWVGWKYVEIDLSEAVTGSNNIGPASYPYGFYQGCGVFWISYQPGPGNGTRSASTVYVDNIQLIYSANTDDTKNPEITSITYDTLGAPEEFVSNETVLSDKAVTIRASFQDAEDKYMTGIDANKVSMSIDGIDVTDKCYVNPGDGQIYFYDAELNNGTHSVSVTVYDNFGNKTTETRYFTIDSDVEASAELVPEQENPVLGSAYTLDIKAADAADIVGADIAVHTFAAFTYFYDDVTVAAAEGYKLVDGFKYDATNAIVSFKLEKDGETVPEDGVLARITYNVPSNVRSDSIDVRFRVDKGGLTFAAEKDEKYLGTFGGTVTTSCIAPLILSSDTFLVGQGGYFYVKDLEGNPVEGAVIVKEDGSPVGEGATDAEGKYFTEAYKDAVTTFKVRAEKDDLISFYYEGQSFGSGGEETGLPSYITLNGKDGATTMNVSWLASPLAAARKAVVKYATKADYDEKGEEALITFEGVSRIEQLDASSNIETNVALLFNKACVTGLKENTEYVYMVGDGEKMSELRTFTTTRSMTDTDFFVIGDMQDEDTTNLEVILDALTNADTDYKFGIQTGDAVDNGGQYRWWSNVGETFSNGYLGSSPIVHVLGNHEYYGDLTGENSADYFGMETLEDGAAPLAYSVTNGIVYTAVINYADSSRANYEKALEWIRADVAETDALWKVISIHQPAYYTNPGGGNDVINELLPPFVDECGFDVVFSGHDHSYTRTYPVTGGEKDEENGAVYFICGSTGEKSYACVESLGFPLAVVKGQGAIAGEYDAVYLTAHVTDTEFTIEAHNVLATKTTETVTNEETGEPEEKVTLDYVDEIFDEITLKRSITCTEDGKHDWGYDEEGRLVCQACGYNREVGNYTGFVKDLETGRNRYFANGVMKTGDATDWQQGWLTIGTDNYNFDENGLARQGEWVAKRTSSSGEHEIHYQFDEEGRQIGIAFTVVPDGTTRGFVANGQLTGWHSDNGKDYYFSKGHPNFEVPRGLPYGAMYTGEQTIYEHSDRAFDYIFAETGELLRGAFEETENGTRYFWAGVQQTGWQEIGVGEEKDTYYFDKDGYMATGLTEIDGETYTFTEDGKRLHKGDHVWDEGKVTTEPTCTEKGVKTFTCANCPTTRTEEVDALGHTEETIPAVAPTCTADGATEGKKCSRCGEILVAPETLTALGHEWSEWKEDKAPTALEDGEESRICARCLEKETRAIPKLTFMKGDVDQNGKITAADARLALRLAVELEDFKPGSVQYEAAEVDGKPKVTAADARLILRAAVELEDPTKW